MSNMYCNKGSTQHKQKEAIDAYTHMHTCKTTYLDPICNSNNGINIWEKLNSMQKIESKAFRKFRKIKYNFI